MSSAAGRSVTTRITGFNSTNPMRQALVSITKLQEPNIKNMTHETQRDWLSKIQYMWKLLEKHGDPECVRVQN